MPQRRPPVIPEIAKAYQNDPKTQLALAALKAGTSTAPVARGRYGFGDGAARIAQALIGAKLDNSAQDQYGGDEAKLLALRQARGVDGLNGASAPPPVPMPQGPPPAPGAATAPAVAAALGAPPPPPDPPQASPGIPMAPVPPPGPGGPPPVDQPPMPPPGSPEALALAQAQGGGPNGRPPFGPQAASAPSYLAPPTQEAVPPAPPPVARPAAPEPVGPTKSRMLNAAYRVMADANPYESASGQDMYQTGLGEQDKLNENAADRAQKLNDMGYQADLKEFGDAHYQDRGAALAGREALIARNAEAISHFKDQQYQYGVHKEDEVFKASESAKERAKDIQIERMKEASDEKTGGGGANALTSDEQAALNKAAGEGRIDVTRLNSRTAKIQAQIFMANPGFDGMTNHGTANLIANAPAQQKAMMAAALPTVLANVRDAGKKINLSDAQFVGKLQAWGKGQVNDPDFIGYMNNRNDAMMTIANVMRGTGATDKAVQLENDAAPKSMSPRAWDAWYAAQMKSLQPRVQMMENRKLLPPGTASSLGDMTTTPPASGKKTGNPLVDKYL